MVSVNYLSVENGLWKIQCCLSDKYGYTQAVRDMSPLNWYISTGRASVCFLRLLLGAKPFMIARILHAGGSDEEVLNRVKAYLHY